MGTTFRPYQPDQMLLLPQDPSGVGSGRALGAPCERPGGRLGSRGVLRAVQRGRAAQLALRSADDGEGADLRVWDGHLLVSEDGGEAGGGHCVSDAGGGQLSAAPDAVRVSPPPSEGLSSGVRRGGLPGAGDGSGGVRTGVGGRDEGSGEREQAQGDELPEELKRREDRLAAIRAAKARLAAEQRAMMDDARGRKPGQSRNPKGGKPYKREYGEPDAKAQSNFTDPESRIMKTSSEGFQQCYNAQTVVDGDNQVVVATTVTDSASDQGQLIPMVDAVRDAFGETPEQVLADAGYCSEPNLQALKERDIDGYVSLAREGTAVMDPDPDKYPAKARMAKKLASEEGRRRYARRKWMAEAPVGWIKEVMGFRRFSFRGLEKVQAEWDLVCLALNVKRLHTLRAA